ncbi:hypothetical protein C0585_05570 [Candidatus Woesearchaeota archaeon]|nr:MAG: hypothetical protein C0585_05570 [Candidatus Woesearchaeota archaeon]
MIECNLFPHDKIRPIQDELIDNVKKAVKNGLNLVAHAPTGLGKTAASISPALEYARENNKTIFFLTSRHTQHKIAIDTLKEIKRKHDLDLLATDIIGKKHMCVVPGINLLHPSEFSEFCKSQREEGNCAFYSMTKKSGKATVYAKKVLGELKKMGTPSVEEIIETSKKNNLCAYEVAVMLSQNSDVIIADYNYIFNRNIREGFLTKIEKLPEDLIIIVDEAHNLPNRVKDMATHRISNILMKRALKEASKYQNEEIADQLIHIENTIRKMSEDLNRENKEKKVSKEDFIIEIEKEYEYDELIASLEFFSSKVLEEEKKSSISSIVTFLEAWRGPDHGFLRMIELKDGLREPLINLSYKCLDPSVITSEIINQSHSTILMSGTLKPINMYSELLGVSQPIEKEFQSPFPEDNRINLIIPKTTTKFQQRSEAQYKNIAQECVKVTDNVPGNSIIFFPSYALLDQIKKYFVELNQKTIFTEIRNMDGETKQELLDNFKKYEKEGSVLLAVVSGSFGEGIDLPGDLLKCVVIVGLPLSTPDLETKTLIDYFDKKFSKGWEYGYTAPAINKVMQNAGRCIRSEKDRGIVVYLDERYAWSNYNKYLPNDKNTLVTQFYEEKIKQFFLK